MIESYKDLIVWQKSMNLVEDIYNTTYDFPLKEQFVLTSQIRRAAISIPSNIAEGYGRNTTKNYIQFLTISRGSLLELETQIELCRRLKYLSDEKFKEIEMKIIEISKMLTALINKLKKKPNE